MPIPGSFCTFHFVKYGCSDDSDQKILSDHYEPDRPTVTASIGDEEWLYYSVKDKGDEFQIKRFPDNGEQATFKQKTYTSGDDERGKVEFASVTATDEGFYTSSKSGQEPRYDSYRRLIVRGVSTGFFY